MTIGKMAQLMRPWCRMKISGLNQVDIHGDHIWTQLLTEAQKLAYWNHKIIKYTIEENTMTVYCIVEEIANE